MKRTALLIAMIALALGACDETDPLEKDEDFILAVMVLDEGSQPIAGMSVGREIELEGFDIFRTGGSFRDLLPAESDTLMFSYPNPFSGVTTVRFLAVGTREAKLDVRDWRGQELRTLLHGRIREGMYSIEWDQMDGAGGRVISGIYSIRLSLADTLDPHVYEFADSIECTVIDFLDPNWREMGRTDPTGFFSMRDLGLFPSLQGHGPQTIYDPMGDPQGSFSVSDTVTITVSTPPPDVGGWIYHMSRRVVLADGPNYLEFHFVPDDSTGVFFPAR